MSDENLWLKEFLDLLALETGLPAPRMCLPNAMIRLIGCVGEALDFLNPRSTSARVCLETALQAEHVQFFNNAKARNELGWKPVRPIQENIGEAVAWFRNETEVGLALAAIAVGEIACSVRLSWQFGLARGSIWWILAWGLVSADQRKRSVVPEPASRPLLSVFKPLPCLGSARAQAGRRRTGIVRGSTRSPRANCCWAFTKPTGK